MQQLSDEQKKVVGADNGIFSVASGPGSGKSTVLLARYVRLLGSGMSPDQILGLTFTAAAAKSLRDRAAKLTTVQKMDTRVAGFVTFHSLCLSICTQEREEFGFDLAEFPLASEAVTRKILFEVSKKFDVDWKKLGSWISLQKRNGVRPPEAIKIAENERVDEKMALAYKSFDTKLRATNTLDFDSMLFEVVSLVEKKPEVRARWQFLQIMVDEAQDCDFLQYKLSKMLSEQHGNLMFIGDFGQSCYSFRGSRPDIFRNLHEMFPTARTMFLGQNFRSTPEIVDFVKSISTDEELAKHFHTQNPSGPTPQVIGFPSAPDQAQHIVRQATVDGACLSRTNRGLSDVEHALSQAGIKYRLNGKCGYFAQPEIKVICAYLQCCVAPLDHSVLAALRGPFHITKFLKKKELADKLKKEHERQPDKTIWRLMTEDSKLSNFVHFIHSLVRYKDLPADEAVRGVIRDLRAIEHFQEEGDPDNNPVENIQELSKIAKRFGSLKDLLDYVRKVSAATRTKKAFTLSTIHGFKGLQASKVMVISCNDGVIPHSKGDPEEERNLYFIACSRPERELQILYHGTPSPYIRHLIVAKPAKPEIEEAFA
jgi:DNA helicase-2/ATP-dependent DNA helicase PcrA